jgi:hypothetical protein
VAGLPPPCGHRDAGHEFSDVSGAATPPPPEQTGSSTRPFFPLGPIGVVVLCQRCTGRWRGGCVIKLWCGGSPRNSSENCAHLESDKVVLTHSSKREATPKACVTTDVIVSPVTMLSTGSGNNDLLCPRGVINAPSWRLIFEWSGLYPKLLMSRRHNLKRRLEHVAEITNHREF